MCTNSMNARPITFVLTQFIPVKLVAVAADTLGWDDCAEFTRELWQVLAESVAFG